MSEQVNILMVDDQPGKLLSYEAILGELGENLIKATSGREALEILLKTDVAVVLMDVSMPEIDGFELAEIIRQHPRYQKTAIIFISAVHLTDLDRLKGYQRGAVDYISVPVVPELLRAKVSVFAELHRKTQQLRRLNRDLEQRVMDRTEEVERRAEMLERVNNELARKNQELDAIMHTAPDIIFSRQANGARDFISDRFYEYTGAPENSASGFGWLEYIHPQDRQESMDHWMRCVQSGENYESEYRIKSKDGEYRWFRARAVPISDAEGQTSKWYGTCSDIHDSKLLEHSMRENAIELEKMVDDRTAELRRLSIRLMKLQDEERRRIARDIHDGLGQELIATKMILDSLTRKSISDANKPNIIEAVKLIDRTVQQVRSISHLLHPPLLDEVGLLSALRWYLDGLTNRSGIQTHLEVPPDLPRLSNELETTIFRIIQEALSNVFRHAQAKNVWVNVALQEEKLLVTVRDDGIGLEEKIVEFRPGSFGVGIGGMRQRALDFGGELRIRNANPGAFVEIVIPTNLQEPSKVFVTT